MSAVTHAGDVFLPLADFEKTTRTENRRSVCRALVAIKMQFVCVFFHICRKFEFL